MGSLAESEPPPSIEVNDLSYSFPDGSLGLTNIFLDLPPGSRTLLIGGKSTRSFNKGPYIHR
jgi:CCR4-NOT complex subunit CAF16